MSSINIEQQLEIKELISEFQEKVFFLTGKHAYVYVDGTDLENDDNVLAFIHQICEHWGINLNQLTTKNKHAPLPTMRHIIFFLIRKKYKSYSSTKIGKIFKCDHSTVLSTCQKLEEYISIQDTQTMLYYNAVKHLLHG